MQVPVAVVPKAPPQVRPVVLTTQQQLSLRRSAINRILANANTPSQETRIALLSRLATRSPPGDGIGDEILQHMFKDYHTNHGHELAVTWLFALYKEHTASSHGVGSVRSAGGLQAERSDVAQGSAEGFVKAESGEDSGQVVVKASEGEEEAGAAAMDVDGVGGKLLF